jgi:indolepyruvate ferredoxin oxidoreductase
MAKAFHPPRRLRALRGDPLDVFGRSAERRMERQLRDDYLALVEELAAKLTPANHALAVEIAAVPEHIRGYGHVKDAHVAKAKAREPSSSSASARPRRRRSPSRPSDAFAGRG